MSKYKKKYSELTFKDDFMFCKVMSSDPLLCKEVIEVCIGEKIGDLTELEPQSSYQAAYDAKGVRFDIRARDTKNRSFDLEMQGQNENDLPKRSRFYLCMLDSKQIEAGRKYQDLGDSYVIFITLFNLFPECGRHKYTVKNIVLEDPKLDFNGGQAILYLCAEGHYDDISPELAALLEYIKTDKPQNELTQRIDDIIIDVKKSGRWSMDFEYCFDKLYEARMEGREEGLEEGRKEERLSSEV